MLPDHTANDEGQNENGDGGEKEGRGAKDVGCGFAEQDIEDGQGCEKEEAEGSFPFLAADAVSGHHGNDDPDGKGEGALQNGEESGANLGGVELAADDEGGEHGGDGGCGEDTKPVVDGAAGFGAEFARDDRKGVGHEVIMKELAHPRLADHEGRLREFWDVSRTVWVGGGEPAQLGNSTPAKGRME